MYPVQKGLLYMKKKVSFHNLGCKVNAYETEAMQQQLRGAGYEIVAFGEPADVCVINTCSVTNQADDPQGQKAESGGGDRSGGLLCPGGRRKNA